MSKAKKQENGNKHRALSAQQTIPYIAMHPDGICQIPGGLYTKTLEYEDINYAVASTEDQTAIISGWSACLNYFDSSLPFQLSFVNRRSRSANRYKVNIPAQEDKETLESIKKGVLYSKDDGDGDTYSMIPPTEDVVSSYSVDVTKDNGKTVHIGGYSTVEELDKAISDAVKNGQLTQEEADSVQK